MNAGWKPAEKSKRLDACPFRDFWERTRTFDLKSI